MDPQLAQIATAHGVWLRREAKSLGYHDATIERLIKDEIWRRVRWGSFTYATTWAQLDDKARYGLLCRAAYRRSRTRVALSHRSAANEWAAPLWDLDLTTVDLTRFDGRAGRRTPEIAQHRGRIQAGDWVEREGIDVMSATRTALELTTQLDIEHSLVEIESLVRQGHTTLAALRDRYELMNHWPDTLHTDLILRLLDDRTESVAETRVRYLCWAQSLPAPEVNCAIRDPRTGQVLFRVDFAWPQLGLWLEFDGVQKYLEHRRENETIEQCVERERRRENRIREITGWHCIRIVWADLSRPRQTADRIRLQFRSTAA